MRNDGGLDQVGAMMVMSYVDSGYIFKIEHTEFPGGLGKNVKGREKSKMTLRFLVFVTVGRDRLGQERNEIKTSV